MSTRYAAATMLTVLALAGVAHGGDFSVHPSITVSEEYTDNVFLTDGNRTGDFITRGMPGIALAYKAPALEAEVNYLYDYRYYANNSRNSDETHNLLATGHLTAVDNLLFLDVKDQYQRVSLDVSKDVTHESLFVNQNDQNVATASPYITLRPWLQTTVKSGYRFVDTRYFHVTDTLNGVDKTDHSGFLEITYEFSPKWSATCGYTFTHEDADTNDFDQHQPFAGFRYEYADKSFLFGQAGYTWIKYADGHLLNNLYWNAGFSHAFATVTVTASTGVKYDEDPLRNITQETFVTAGLEKALQRGAVGLSLYYSEFALAETNDLQTRKYGGVARARHEFTPRLNGTLAFTAEKYDQYIPVHSYTRRFLVESSLGYLLAEKLTVALNHTLADSYSPAIATDNYQANRVILEVKKEF